jgi:hypothetical protein
MLKLDGEDNDGDEDSNNVDNDHKVTGDNDDEIEHAENTDSMMTTMMITTSLFINENVTTFKHCYLLSTYNATIFAPINRPSITPLTMPDGRKRCRWSRLGLHS